MSPEGLVNNHNYCELPNEHGKEPVFFWGPKDWTTGRIVLKSDLDPDG